MDKLKEQIQDIKDEKILLLKWRYKAEKTESYG